MSAREEPVAVTLHDGSDLACVVCGSATFFPRRARIVEEQSRLPSLPAGCCVCARCGFVHWFMGERHPAASDE